MTTITNYDKARAQMLLKHPFFAAMVLSTNFIEDRTIPTACTNMINVRYNPDFMDSLDVPTCIFVLVHEIMHVLLKHGLRRGSRKPKRANMAMDYAINQELEESGITVWSNCLIDKKYAGMPFEQIYDILDDEAGGGDSEDPDGTGFDVDPDARDSMTPAEAEDLSRQIDRRIAQAATMARAAGKMPANLDLLVEGILNPPQPWEVILREFMTRMVQSHETWNRRNRRFTSVLPSREAKGMGELCIIGDTSGSMMIDNIFAQIAAEINYSNEMVKPERTRVVWADDEECSNEQVFEEGDPVVLEPKGGGGTDMRLPLAYMEQFDPCVVLLITDCYTPWPDGPTPYPLIVLSTTDEASPDWAMRIRLHI
jgi:predicted metal-dependent peptidase